MKATTKTMYCEGNAFGGCYASNNYSGYGTKWRIRIKENEYGRYDIIGTPLLLDANWDIDQEKVDDTDFFYERFC